jgi:hypothetical protein
MAGEVSFEFVPRWAGRLPTLASTSRRCSWNPPSKPAAQRTKRFIILIDTLYDARRIWWRPRLKRRAHLSPGHHRSICPHRFKAAGNAIGRLVGAKNR